MPTQIYFDYEVRYEDGQGAVKTIMVEAYSAVKAFETISAQGYYVLSVDGDTSYGDQE